MRLSGIVIHRVATAPSGTRENGLSFTFTQELVRYGGPALELWRTEPWSGFPGAPGDRGHGNEGAKSTFVDSGSPQRRTSYLGCPRGRAPVAALLARLGRAE